ncbi:hypothetical protein Bca101_018992 [Brassica carinata]
MVNNLHNRYSQRRLQLLDTDVAKYPVGAGSPVKVGVTDLVCCRTLLGHTRKPKYRNTSCIVEEGQNRLLTGGSLQGDARVALFKLEGDVILEFLVFINADRVSPFDLATRRL